MESGQTEIHIRRHTKQFAAGRYPSQPINSKNRSYKYSGYSRRNISASSDNGTGRKSYVIYGFCCHSPECSRNLVAGQSIPAAMVALDRSRSNEHNLVRYSRTLVDDPVICTIHTLRILRHVPLEKERQIYLRATR